LRVARRVFSAGIIEEPVKSALGGTAEFLTSPNGCHWIKVTDAIGSCIQLFPVAGCDPIRGWSQQLEQTLQKGSTIAFTETPTTEGTKTYVHNEDGQTLVVIQAGERFDAAEGQRLFFTNKRTITQEVSIKDICIKTGPLAAAEYLLHVCQRIYNAQSRVADHHFEIIIRTMMQNLTVETPQGSDHKKGAQMTLAIYLNSQNKPAVLPKTVLQAALTGSGFLSRLAFRNTSRNLMTAALAKEGDWIKGIKEKIITGTVAGK